jgi:hypothetical protein
MSAFEDKRPKIQLPGDNRLLGDFGAELGRAMQPTNMFRRGELVYTVNAAGDRLERMAPDRLRTWLEQYAVCYKMRNGATGEVIQIRRTMSQGDAVGVLAAPQFLNELREIERFNPVRMPIRRFDGRIELLHPGYDEYAKVYTADNAPLLVDCVPMDMAKEIVDELLSEFVFADGGRSKAVAVAAMVSVFALGILPPRSVRPCFIVLANAEGAGKTLLVKTAVVPALGYAPSAVLPRDDDEMRKVLLSAVIEATPVLFFDNYKGHLASEALEGFLTSQDWSGRVLGGQATFRGENNCLVFVTGNGCTVSPDMRRRSLFCELFLEVDRAEDRRFNQYLEVPVLLERRNDILAALWAFVRDWHQAMEPKPSRTHSGFPEWAANIAGIVEYAGYGCPLETPLIEAAADVDSDDMRALVKAIANGSLFGSVSFDELVQISETNGLFERFTAGLKGEKTKMGSASTFGKILRSYDGRLVGEHRFLLAGKGKGRKYVAEKAVQESTNGIGGVGRIGVSVGT